MGLTGVYDLHLLKAIAIGTDVDASPAHTRYRLPEKRYVELNLS